MEELMTEIRQYDVPTTEISKLGRTFELVTPPILNVCRVRSLAGRALRLHLHVAKTSDEHIHKFAIYQDNETVPGNFMYLATWYTSGGVQHLFLQLNREAHHGSDKA